MSLADEKYVSLVTYKRDGSPVATAVWVVEIFGELGVITEANAGKVKRIRNNPRVAITPCDVRGRLTQGSTPVEATARLVTGREAVLVRRAIRRKYFFAYVWISLTWVVPELLGRLRRTPSKAETAILIRTP